LGLVCHFARLCQFVQASYVVFVVHISTVAARESWRSTQPEGVCA
jgi:hypothetical protein